MTSAQEQKLEEANFRYEKLRREAEERDRDLQDKVVLYGKSIAEEIQKHATLRDAATKYEQEIEYLRGECKEAVAQIISLQVSLKAKELERSQAETEAAIRSQQELQNLAARHEEEAKYLRVDYEGAAAQIDALKSKLEEKDLELAKSKETTAQKFQQNLQELNTSKEQEARQLRHDLETAAGEVASLQHRLKDLERQRSNPINNKEVDAFGIALYLLNHRFDNLTPRSQASIDLLSQEIPPAMDEDEDEDEAVKSISSTFKSRLLEGGIDLNEPIKTDSFLAFLSCLVKMRYIERDRSVEEVEVLAKTLVEMNVQKVQMTEELKNLSESREAIELERQEATKRLTSLEAKLELAETQSEEKEAEVAAIRNNLKELQFHIDNSSANMDHERNEAAVEIALLKNKLELARTQRQDDNDDADHKRKEVFVELNLLKHQLELAELQSREASEEVERTKKETVVDIALLKDKLELAELHSREDKGAIAALRKEVERLQVQLTDAPNHGSCTAHQLREELSMLGRHHDANLADVTALRATLKAESEEREEEWRRRATAMQKLVGGMKEVGAEITVQ
ncbi:hypothetical protein N7G274_002566 [Stereocaulon virgatum]|uniref:Uncharacterized protein n=1 Tax=Stereocaulon virgatum TaxID=373712 RepID=A0ABR4AIZ5_9LECA